MLPISNIQKHQHNQNDNPLFEFQNSKIQVPSPLYQTHTQLSPVFVIFRFLIPITSQMDIVSEKCHQSLNLLVKKDYYPNTKHRMEILHQESEKTNIGKVPSSNKLISPCLQILGILLHNFSQSANLKDPPLKEYACSSAHCKAIQESYG
jgi:hypothetical protein